MADALAVQYIGGFRLVWIEADLADVFLDGVWLGSARTVAAALQRFRRALQETADG